MERLAMSLPLHFLRKHSDSQLTMEALFFGQGGFLDNAPKTDPYVEELIREHKFFAHKFSLRPLQPLGWKMARMRPHNFPHRRIALLAQLVASDFRLVRKITSTESIDSLRELSASRSQATGPAISLSGQAANATSTPSAGTRPTFLLSTWPSRS